MALDGASQNLLSEDDALRAVEQQMLALSIEHGGVLGEIAAEHLATGGKRVRARLALAAAEALGVARDRAVPWATAVELVHNASLIHDDLQDGDVVRRGRPTTWVRWGAAQAINVGDFLLVLPWLSIRAVEAGARVRAGLSTALAEAICAMTRGQALEPALPEACRDGEGRDAYRLCIEGKTAALFGAPARGAALLAGLEEDEAAAIGAIFERVGVLFQLQDDVLDLYGDKGRKDAGNDVREGKVSALVVEHLERNPDDASWLLGILDKSRTQTTDRDVADVSAAFVERGALDGVLGWIASISAEIASAPELRERPALRLLASTLLDLVLRPISHLFDEPLADEGIEAQVTS
jgi:geranylgeranyl diphosphate synthase type I